MNPSTDSLSIFSYSEYRTFLKDAYSLKRQENRKFSHRFIAAKMGFTSSSWFSDLLTGRMKLMGPHRVKLARLMDLNERETDYFEFLVQYNQAESLADKNHYFQRLHSFKESKTELVSEEKFLYYSQWYFTAVREILFLHDFRGDYGALAKRLRPAITTAQAKQALALLTKLDFVFKDAQGCLRPRPLTLKKDSAFKSLHADNFLAETMKLGMQAIDRFDPGARHISALTLSFSGSGFRKVKAEIDIFRKRLVALMNEDPHPETVYQINIQSFPLTD